MTQFKVGDIVQFIGDPEEVQFEVVDDNRAYPRAGAETYELSPVGTPDRQGLDWIPARLLAKVEKPLVLESGDIVEDENDSVFIYNKTSDRFYEEVYTWREGSRYVGLDRDELYGNLKVIGKVILEEKA